MLAAINQSVVLVSSDKFVLFIPGYLSVAKCLNEFIEEGERIYSLLLQ
ncbi:hypothetical protein KKF70_06535 [bacterium]|nr:hypothetical protein [bacterium]MBU3930218.1 hypothetical protein [bacterium]